MKLKVLFISANPASQVPLDLENEVRNVQNAINAHSNRDEIELIYRLASQLEDLISTLNREKPHILHFSGHGVDGGGELCFVDDEDITKDIFIPIEALDMLFETLKDDNLRLVFLNSCYSKVQAGVILKHIDYVIGMNRAINDNTAKTLSTQFYASFASGVSIQKAFKQAKMMIISKHYKQKTIPELLMRNESVQDFSIVDIVGKEEQKATKGETNNITVNGDINGIASVSGGTVHQTINKKTINADKNFEHIEVKNGGTAHF